MRQFSTNNIKIKIYASRASMRNAIKDVGFDGSSTESMVIPCSAYTFKNGKQIILPVCGEMYLHQRISMPVLVHECLHAATTVLRSRNKNLKLSRNIDINEERLAYMQTSILQDILQNFFPKKNSNYDLKDIEWWAKKSVTKNKNHKK